MSIYELFAELEQKSINLQVADNNLKINAPKGSLTPDLMAELKSKKEEIIRFLQKYVEKEERFNGIEPAEKKEYYTLSTAQKRMYILNRLDRDSTGYNMPTIIELEGALNITRVENIFRRLAQRHESFRTSFEMIGDEPTQIIHENVEFEIEYLAAEGGRRPQPLETIIKTFIRPFDLSKAPLMRVGLIKIEEEKHILMVDMYHIISDGTSSGIFIKEFMSFYSGEELPPPNLHYKDYSEWMKRDTQIEMVKKQEEFWLNLFEGEIPSLDLPMDFVRPVTQSFEGNALVFKIGKKETGLLKALAIKEYVTLYMIMLSIYNIFLSKLSGKEDIIIGTPVAGRKHSDLQSIIGMFVNTLALRNFPGGNKTFRQFLLEVKKKTLDAFANQDYPYEGLVEKKVKEREPGRNPLFDTLFTLQTIGIPVVEVPGLKLKGYESEEKISKFDLSLEGTEVDDILYFTLYYNIKLFKESSIKRSIGYIERIIEVVAENSDVILSSIEMISEGEKYRILNEFNNTEASLLEEKTVHDLFKEQVGRTPDHVALVKEKTAHSVVTHELNELKEISYRKLNEQSDQIAFLLSEKGVHPGDIVGIKMERSIEMIEGILGILKAGAAYLPIDPKFPQERVDFMLKDSGAKLSITIDNLKEFPNVLTSQLPNFHLLPATGNRQPATSLAYITYTSGSTGKPKGVMIEHRSVASRVKNSNFIEVKTGDRLLMTGAFIFDIAAFEIWFSLSNGLQLVLVNEKNILDAEKLKRVIIRNKISILHLIPQLFNQLAQQDEEIFGYLDYFLVGGDVVNPHNVNLVRKRYPGLKIRHMYGPTENTIFTTYLQVEKDYQGRIPIGKPINNSIVLILDKYLQLQPIGAMGELYVGGAGVARGYINNPQLTAERFISFDIINPKPKTQNPKLYLTGDLARWLDDGNIEFLGRQDQQVKIRGIRIEVEEIERILSKYKGIKEVVVIAKEVRGDKTLCAYIVAGVLTGSFSEFIIQIKEEISRILPGYMIPAYFIEVKEIPLLPNGKIDRKVMPEPEIRAGDAYIAPKNKMEEMLVEIWSEVLGIEKSQISMDFDFFQLGGHSLKATILVSRIYKYFNVKITLGDIFKESTIRKQGLVISSSGQTLFIDIPKVETREYYPLSFNQRRLYVLYQMQPESPAYNMPGVIELEGNKVDEVLVKQVLDKLTERHESFRTGFITVDDHPFQVVKNEIETRFEILDFSGQESSRKNEKLEASYIRIATAPFDLFKVPLFRAALVKIEPNRYRLIFNMSHIISDGWSLELLKKEFLQLYESYRKGEEVEVPPLPIQYKDFAVWHNRQLEGPEGEQSHQFWKERLSGGVPTLNLPVDNEIGQMDITGAVWSCMIDNHLKEQLKKLAESNNTTLFTVMFSVYNLFLFGVSGQNEVVCSVIAAGRDHPSLHQIIGFFVNSILLKTRVDSHKPFNEFLREVNRNVIETFQYQTYPFERVFEEMGIKYPEISVSFNMFNVGDASESSSTGDLEPVHIENSQDVKFDLEVYLTEMSNGISMSWAYKKNMFEPETMNFMLKKYIKQLRFFEEKPDLCFNDFLVKERNQKVGRFKKRKNEEDSE